METATTHKEMPSGAINGWLALATCMLAFLGFIALFFNGLAVGVPLLVILAVLGFLLTAFMCKGFLTLDPNTAAVFILFGSYRGTLRKSGFFWRNPLMRSEQLSLRARNFNGETLKVNDKRGNPIEIAAVVVWRVSDSAQALFDVDNYEQYVAIQSESALRHLANAYAYDHGELDEVTLLSSTEKVRKTLQDELQERMNTAGVIVDEARLTHLAYAPEIAQVMLRRQQAEAIISARSKIVQGAVGMVDMALEEISRKALVELDDERKASMVSNLLVVLCSESETSPVINTGTLYS